MADPVKAQGPEVVELHAGQRVWYVREGERQVRPAILISDGITDTIGGKQYATIAYGTLDDSHQLLGHDSPKPEPGNHDDRARVVSQRQTHEVTAPWDPSGKPGTWHLDGEGEDIQHPKPKGAPKGQVAEAAKSIPQQAP